MRLRFPKWLLAGLICLAAAVVCWRWAEDWQTSKNAKRSAESANVAGVSARRAAAVAQPPGGGLIALLSQPGSSSSTQPTSSAVAPNSRFPFRLSNTSSSLNELARKDHAILLANALLDTSQRTDLPIPDHLRARGEHGSYVVQARGLLDNEFRASLRDAGATIVSYIPNNAYLVRVSAADAQRLGANRKTQAVIAYEPYFKIAPPLLKLVVEQKPLPPNNTLNLTLFADARDATLESLARLGAEIVAEDRSPFGPVVTIHPLADTLAAVARLPGVQSVELFHERVLANDLGRARLGVAVNSVARTNYFGLTGTNVLVAVDDTGVDATHPDLTLRVFGDRVASLTDSNGHGTHVIGTILGDGAMSTTVTNARGSIMPGTNGQFRGQAPAAKAFVITGGGSTYAQEAAARTNALISNNSWHLGSSEYNITAASYDAAVRDALPGVPGSQPVLFVFAAGDGGSGKENGLDGNYNTIASPATAKNVISVGAIEQPRNITNEVVWRCVACTTCTNSSTTCETNKWWLGRTDSDNQVTASSGRGNIGVGLEGDFGRFKPDVMAPGTFVISTRSAQWDQAAYYNPTNHHVNTFFNRLEDTNYSIFVRDNAVGLAITVWPNNRSPVPFPDMPLRVSRIAMPTNAASAEFIGTNRFSAPPDLPLNPVGAEWFYSVDNTYTQAASFNVTTDITTTNDNGNYFEVLSNLNNTIGPYYRYESGSSMAAAGVSGMLALMQEFFEQRLGRTNSPALMKALLINGARSVNSELFRYGYDYQVRRSIPNHQGWGLAQLPTTLPPGISNLNALAGSPVLAFDQDPVTNALATGQSHTRLLTVAPEAQIYPLRVTLVWTDPPGNPAASIKLVNDLDLVVTNLDTGEVFFGNDIPAGSDFNMPGDTNAPALDVVNNVENVYLGPTLGSNYAVTVVGRRVNVNAVTAHTNDVVQDFALVISSGNGEVTNALTFVETPTVGANVPFVSPVTNSFGAGARFTGGVLLNQHVGASTPLLGTNTIPLGNPAGALVTLGVTNQWTFYVITNVAGYTNAAFVTFLPPTLSIPRIGVRETDLENATRVEADIDLYVSTDPGLTNLDSAVLTAADKSLRRDGTESIIYSNAVAGQVYYIGVHAEDREAAEYGFLAIFSELPFAENDNGNWILRGIPVPALIPDGPPEDPGAALVFGLAPAPISVRRVVVTNNVTHEDFGDLLGNLSHNQKFAVLNDHTYPPGGATNWTFIYEDNGEGDIPGSRRSDGPGSLRNFIGEEGIGVWLLTMVDNALEHTGQVNELFIRLEPTIETNDTIATVQAYSWFYDFIDVPPEATNLTIRISQNNLPLQLFLRRGALPTLTAYDKTATINPPGGSLSIGTTDSPPLSPGRYYIGVYNPNGVAVTFRFSKRLDLDPRGVVPTIYASTGDEPLLDDAVTNSIITVSDDRRIARVEVGVRIDHPRVSDLVLHLVSPNGTRVLLSENRGAWNANGMGSTLNVTNIVPVSTNGGPATSTNFVDTGTTSGSLTIDYDFFQIPDQMTVYYDGTLLLNSGMISGAGRFTVNFGPGASTQVMIIMNEFGNANTNTAWNYTVSSVQKAHSYLVFTENTNLTSTPIKFSSLPFASAATNVTQFVSGFEPAAAGDYVAPAVVDGWSVLTDNPVTVIDDAAAAHTGTKYLSLRSGQIQRTLPTTQGRGYNLRFAYRSPVLDGLVSWWPGEGNANDIVDGNPGVLSGGVTYASGMVGQAFSFNGTGEVRIADNANLNVRTNLTLEAWVFPTVLDGQNDTILYKESDNFSPNQYALSLRGPRSVTCSGTIPTGRLMFGLLGVTGMPNDFCGWVDGGGNVPTNQWTHVAVTFDGATARAYINGNVTRTITGLGGVLNVSTGPLKIGSRGAAEINLHPYERFNGLIDEVAIFNRALAPAEVQAIYNAGAAGKCGMATPPAVCGSSGAQAFVPGLVTNLFGGTTNWLTNSLTFTAPKNGTELDVWAGTPQTGHAQLANGSFELGFAGWTTNSAGIGISTTVSPASDGTNCVGLGGGDVPGAVLYQILPIDGGANYVLSFNFLARGNPGRTGVVQVVVDSASGILASQTFTNAAQNTLPYVFQKKSVPFTVPAGVNSVMLEFIDLSPFSGIDVDPTIDNVRIAPPESRVNLDTFTLTETAGPLYVLPEESLSALIGENAKGDWKLEIWDNRTGAANLVSQLISWQLSFIFERAFPAPIGLTHGVAQTNTVGAGQIRYFYVDVPAWANFATNTLFNATAPLNLLFNQNGLPTGTNGPGDFTLLANVLNGTATLATNTTPPLLPGYRYYLSVQNSNAALATFSLEVDFDVTPLSNGVPVTSSLAATFLPRYFSYDVSVSATAVSFELLNLSGDVNLVARRGAPLPDLGSFDYASFNPGTNDESIIVFTNSMPMPLAAGRWFLGVFNNDVTNVAYTILATEYTNAFPNIITLINAIPYANSNSGSGDATDYYRYQVSTNAVRAQFEINGPSADLTLVARKGLPLPGLTNYSLLSANSGANDELIVFYDYSSPVPLTPGEWFISAVNISGGPATYTIKASDWPLYGTNIVITDQQVISNSFCLTWTSLPGVHYVVQGKTDLVDPTWANISPTLTATDYLTTYCIPLPSAYHFFRVKEGILLSSYVPPVTITRIYLATNGVALEWNAPTNALFNVQWSPTLTPLTWNTFTNVVTSATGLFNFTDDGAQSGGFEETRYYRLLFVP